MGAGASQHQDERKNLPRLASARTPMNMPESMRNLSLFDAEFYVGDVVKAKVDSLFFEGVVVSLYEESLLVDFGDGELQAVNKSLCRKKLSWDMLEVGDIALVKEQNGCNSFEAKILEAFVTAEGVVYTVEFGENDIEQNVPQSRLRKIKSERLTNTNLWKKAYNTVVAINALKKEASLAAAKRDHNIPEEKFQNEESKEGADTDPLESSDGRQRHSRQQDSDQSGNFDQPERVITSGDEDNEDQISTKQSDKGQTSDIIEVGDKVQAKSCGLWFSATVVSVQDFDKIPSQRSYTVRWDDVDTESKDDDQDLENDIPADCVRKLQSGRLRGKELWRKTHGVMGVMAAFQRTSANRTKRNLIDDSKEDDGSSDDDCDILNNRRGISSSQSTDSMPIKDNTPLAGESKLSVAEEEAEASAGQAAETFSEEKN